MKRKVIRGNEAPCMTKALKKSNHEKTRNEILKNKTTHSLKNYKKHKNYCSRLYKKERRKYYDKFDLKNITDNKKFWKTIKPFLSNKNPLSSKINLVKDNEISYI